MADETKNVEVDDVFEMALKAKKEQEAEVEQKKNYVPTDYEEVEYCALKKDKEIVFRPVGAPFNPQTLKSTKPTDIKFTLISQIEKDDKSGYITVRWPAVTKTTRAGVKIVPDPDFILTKLYNKVYENEWVNYPEGVTEIRNKKKCTGEYKFFHKDTAVYERLEVNGEKGLMNKFYPKPAIYMNVIDRMDSWCVDNKKTKLLISALNPGKEKVNAAGEKFTPMYPSKGISNSLYDKIFNCLVKVSGGWNRDCVVKKTGEKLETEYSVFDASTLRVQTTDISQEAFDLAKESGMPDDWEMIDLSVMTDPSSAFKLKRNLIGLFKLFDSTFPGFNLTEELEEIVKIEQEEYNKKNKTEADT